MKKIYLITGGVLIVIMAVLAILRFSSSEDTWLCVDGQWIEHGRPSAAMPTSPCPGTQTTDETGGAEDNHNMVQVTFPPSGAEVASPLIVRGEARGPWYFEASFPVRLVDAQGNVISSSIAEAQGEWMTEDFVPFTANLDFSVTAPTNAELVLVKDNPSGLPENDAEIRQPIVLLPSVADGTATMTVKAYFLNDRLDPEVACDRVFPVERTVPETTAVGQAAIYELLKGPTDTEFAAGYSTAINTGTALNSLKIENGTAYADFNARLNQGVAGSCLVTAIRTQISQTLEQFPTVDNVEISVDGESEGILQP